MAAKQNKQKAIFCLPADKSLLSLLSIGSQSCLKIQHHHGQIKIEIGRPPIPRVQQNTAMDIFSDPPSKPAFPPAYTGAKKRSTKAWRSWAGDHPEDAKVFNEAMAAYYAERKAWWKECEERVLCAFCPTLYFGRYGEKNTPV